MSIRRLIGTVVISVCWAIRRPRRLRRRLWLQPHLHVPSIWPVCADHSGSIALVPWMAEISRMQDHRRAPELTAAELEAARSSKR